MLPKFQPILFWATIAENWEVCFVLVSHSPQIECMQVWQASLRDSNAEVVSTVPLSL
jgi:hypothetical protein